MSNYEIDTIRDATGSTFNVVERSTGNVVWSTRDWNEARQTVRHFKQGGGFNGWTPHFVTVKTADLSVLSI